MWKDEKDPEMSMSWPTNKSDIEWIPIPCLLLEHFGFEQKKKKKKKLKVKKSKEKQSKVLHFLFPFFAFSFSSLFTSLCSFCLFPFLPFPFSLPLNPHGYTSLATGTLSLSLQLSVIHLITCRKKKKKKRIIFMLTLSSSNPFS